VAYLVIKKIQPASRARSYTEIQLMSVTESRVGLLNSR